MDYALARHNMVETQIRTNRVTDPRLIEALETVPREIFVPEHLKNVAYIDEDLKLGKGRILMEPKVFARLLQEAAVKAGEVVLDVGCASGYSAAVLARLASTVVALESDTVLAARAGESLAQLGIDNVAVVTSALAAGDAQHGPYDVIVVEGAIAEIPDSLTRQLADGGRLLAVVEGESGLGRATLVLKSGSVLSSRILFDAAIKTLPEFNAVQGFTF